MILLQRRCINDRECSTDHQYISSTVSILESLTTSEQNQNRFFILFLKNDYIFIPCPDLGIFLSF